MRHYSSDSDWVRDAVKQARGEVAIQEAFIAGFLWDYSEAIKEKFYEDAYRAYLDFVGDD